MVWRSSGIRCPICRLPTLTRSMQTFLGAALLPVVGLVLALAAQAQPSAITLRVENPVEQASQMQTCHRPGRRHRHGCLTFARATFALSIRALDGRYARRSTMATATGGRTPSSSLRAYGPQKHATSGPAFRTARHAPVLLQPAEEALDLVPVATQTRVMRVSLAANTPSGEEKKNGGAGEPSVRP
jgi:hypothetical protein